MPRLSAPTNWTAYYQTPAPTAFLSRSVTRRRLVDILLRFSKEVSHGAFVELGGGNSCVFPSLRQVFEPSEYLAVDNNPLGLRLLEEGHSDTLLKTRLHDVLSGDPPSGKAAVCLSVGLIEHFSAEGTQRVIARHFDWVRPGGLVLMTFPTPTWLYRAARSALEWSGSWAFPDERPLPLDEVIVAGKEQGTLLHSEINWPILLTQGITLFRKSY